MLDEFKQFLLRGNVVELGVAVVIGVAFTAVITAFVDQLVTPFIAIFLGETDFSNLAFSIRGSEFGYGIFLNALLAFITVAAVIFFLVVRPVNRLTSRYTHEETPEPTTRKCPFCVQDVPLEATRCAFCTSELGAATTVS